MSYWLIILTLMACYAIGAIPSAYLLVKWVYKIDVTRQGSGNVGTLNALRTTRSKWLSAVVLVADFSKGLIAVVLSQSLFPEIPWVAYAGAFAAVMGHNYSVYLKGKGGRGLATAAGGVAVLAPQLIGIWLGLWIVAYLIRRQIIYSSVFATVILLFFLWWPDEYFVSLYGAWAVTGIAGLILIKHIPRVRDVWMENKRVRKNEWRIL